MSAQPDTRRTDRFRFSERAEPFRAGAAHGYTWRPQAPSASLVLLHGLQSHAQWFAEAGDELAARGFTVYALDRHGSGSSPGERGDVGDYLHWLVEIGEVVRLAREQGGLPIHLVGHCFGANLAVGYALQHPEDVASIAMLTPGFYVLPDYSPGEKGRILVSGLLGRKWRFRVPQDDDLFTRDPEVLAWITADSLGAKELTGRCLLQINRMLRWLRGHAGELQVPVLVLEAGRDRLSDNARNRALLERALGESVQIVTFDAEHFLLAEPCAAEVLDELERWVRR